MSMAWRLSIFATVTALVMSLLLLLLISPVFAATATWDGGGGDANFSTAANWVGDVVPSAGDDLVFDNDTADFDSKPPINDMSVGTSFNSIRLQGSGSDGPVITGNSLDLAGDVTNSSSGGAFLALEVDLTTSATVALAGSAGIRLGALLSTNTFSMGANPLNITNSAANTYIYSDISGSATLTRSAGSNLTLAGDNSSFDGEISLTSGTLTVANEDGLGSSLGTTTVASGTQLYLAPDLASAEATIVEDISIGGSGLGSAKSQAAIYVSSTTGANGGGGVSETSSANDLNLSGSISLSADTTISSDATMAGNTITFSDLQVGSNVLTIVAGTSATIAYGSDTFTGTTEKITYSDAQGSVDVDVEPNSEVTITGTRGDVGVQRQAILKGDGTIGNVTVYSGGTLAPGLSPGCLNSGDLTLTSGSTLEVEIEGTTICTEYDQTDVTGAVDLGGATLDLQIINSFIPAGGETFNIVNNDLVDATVGTFSGLVEGATLTENGYDYFITYQGGDGNDVVLTAAIPDAPSAPATGFLLFDSQPAMIAGVTSLFSVMLIGFGYMHKQKQ